LAVQDLQASKAFYEKLGFEVFGGDASQTTGPASFVVVDPDGNPILVDQHV
jgi:catechol 2,3-dioxygenase-like lactoylglutathione lyase family enzyme